MERTLTNTVITALLSFFLCRCPILPLMVNTPVYHPASVNVPLLFPLCYRNYDLTVNGYKNVKTHQITVIWWVRNSNLAAVRSIELLLLYLLSLHPPVFFFSSSVFVCPAGQLFFSLLLVSWLCRFLPTLVHTLFSFKVIWTALLGASVYLPS